MFHGQVLTQIFSPRDSAWWTPRHRQAIKVTRTVYVGNMAFCTREDWLVAGHGLWWDGSIFFAFFTKYGSMGATYIYSFRYIHSMWGSQNSSQLWRSWNDWLWYAKLGCLRPNTYSKLGLKHIQWTHKRSPGQSVVRNWSASRQVFSAKLWRMSRKCDESAEMWLLHFASNSSPSMSVLTMAHSTVWVRVKTLEPWVFSQKLLANGYPSSSSHSNDPPLLEVFIFLPKSWQEQVYALFSKCGDIKRVIMGASPWFLRVGRGHCNVFFLRLEPRHFCRRDVIFQTILLDCHTFLFHLVWDVSEPHFFGHGCSPFPVDPLDTWWRPVPQV